jgi:hypothetical protein
MNKIERAIQDVKTEISRMQKAKIAAEARIEAYLETLESLESIERDNHIPHSNPTVVVTKDEISMKRFDEWKLYNKDNFDLTNECTFTDGFARGALWMQGELIKNK